MRVPALGRVMRLGLDALLWNEFLRDSPFDWRRSSEDTDLDGAGDEARDGGEAERDGVEAV